MIVVMIQTVNIHVMLYDFTLCQREGLVYTETNVFKDCSLLVIMKHFRSGVKMYFS